MKISDYVTENKELTQRITNIFGVEARCNNDIKNAELLIKKTGETLAVLAKNVIKYKIEDAESQGYKQFQFKSYRVNRTNEGITALFLFKKGIDFSPFEENTCFWHSNRHLMEEFLADPKSLQLEENMEYFPELNEFMIFVCGLKDTDYIIGNVEKSYK